MAGREREIMRERLLKGIEGKVTRKHLVVLKSRQNPGLQFEAYLRDGISYDIKLWYDSLFKDFINVRNIFNKIVVGIKEMERFFSVLKDFKLNEALVGGLSWSRKFGGIPEYLEFTIPLRLWVEDSLDDIRKKLEVLYKMSVPEMGAYITFLDIEKYQVHVFIGDWFEMEQAYITGIGHKWSEALVTDGKQTFPAYVDLDIGITSVYIVGSEQLKVGSKVQVIEYTEPQKGTTEESKQDKVGKEEQPRTFLENLIFGFPSDVA